MEGVHDPAANWARRLASGARIDAPVALVIAHPDDETLWAGATLPRLAQLTLVLLTDGAPRDMADAGRLGIATHADYAARRAAELDAALAALGVAPKRIAYGLPDQEVTERIAEVAERLARDLIGVEAILTHPYEGGHPDHDAAALAVRLAARRMVPAPAVVEFACYHQVAGERRFGVFWPDDGAPEQVRALTEEERVRVDRAIAAHATQAAVIGDWRPEAERWRAAPACDFALPPPPGVALYDGFGWAMTSARWRALAAEAIASWR